MCGSPFCTFFITFLFNQIRIVCRIHIHGIAVTNYNIANDYTLSILSVTELVMQIVHSFYITLYYTLRVSHLHETFRYHHTSLSYATKGSGILQIVIGNYRYQSKLYVYGSMMPGTLPSPVFILNK